MRLANELVKYRSSADGTALIDGDIIVYRCGFAGQSNQWTLTWTENGVAKKIESSSKREINEFILQKNLILEDYNLDVTVHPDPLNHVLHTVRAVIDDIVRRSYCKDYKVFLTNTGGIDRDKIATIRKYKGTRTGGKPVYYDDIRRYLQEYHPCEMSKRLEADDLLGINQAEHAKHGRRSVIASLDKDLDMVPGWHYNWVKNELYNVSPEESKYFFFRQMLTGDAVDNIFGIPGLGPKTADKLIKFGMPLDKCIEVVEQVYKTAVKTMKDKEEVPDDWYAWANENAKLLWMMRSYDQDPTKENWTYKNEELFTWPEKV